jgi:hypothetical protein
MWKGNPRRRLPREESKYKNYHKTGGNGQRKQRRARRGQHGEGKRTTTTTTVTMTATTTGWDAKRSEGDSEGALSPLNGQPSRATAARSKVLVPLDAGRLGAAILGLHRFDAATVRAQVSCRGRAAG